LFIFLFLFLLVRADVIGPWDLCKKKKPNHTQTQPSGDKRSPLSAELEAVALKIHMDSTHGIGTQDKVARSR
jgi:hypothetical protein